MCVYFCDGVEGVKSENEKGGERPPAELVKQLGLRFKDFQTDIGSRYDMFRKTFGDHVTEKELVAVRRACHFKQDIEQFLQMV